MRLIALTPAHVGAPETARRQERYDTFAAGGVAVEVRDQPDEPQVPRSFDTPELIASADLCVLDRVGELTLEDGDVILPDCVLDTSLEGIQSQGLPAQGIMRLTVNLLNGLGLKFGAVARNKAVGDRLDERIRGYDTAGGYVGIAVLDLPTEAVTNAELWNGALSEKVAELAARGAQAVINGCSAVDVTAECVIPVVDPTQLAVGCITLASGLGILPAAGGAK